MLVRGDFHDATVGMEVVDVSRDPAVARVYDTNIAGLEADDGQIGVVGNVANRSRVVLADLNVVCALLFVDVPEPHDFATTTSGSLKITEMH